MGQVTRFASVRTRADRVSLHAFTRKRRGADFVCSNGTSCASYNEPVPKVLKFGLPAGVVIVLVLALAVIALRGDDNTVEIVPDPPPQTRVVTDKSPGISEIASQTGPETNAGKGPAGTGETDSGSDATEEPSGDSQPPEASVPAPSTSRSMIATAKVPSVHILRTAPEGITETRLPTPAPNGSELPSDQLSIEGRQKTSDGWEILNPEPYGGTAAFWVVQQAEGWVRVMVPVRPNNQTGWISTDEVELSETKARVHVDLSDRRVTAFDDSGNRIVDTSVAVGAPGSPTPTGWFSITDISPSNPNGTYGPAIVGTSGLSEALERFDSGAPQIALHGWQKPSAFGRAVSNGCVRVPNSEIVKIAGLPRGAPVVVEP